MAGEPGGEFFRLPFQKDEDFCDFFHFNFPKTSKFISRRINRFKTDFMRLKKKSSRISDWRNEATSIKELLDWNDLVRRINAWRIVCRLSVLELSKRAGLSRPTVTALLHGSAKISIENVQKVLAALDAAAQPKKLSIEEVIKEKSIKNDTVTGDGFPMLTPGTTTIACAGNVPRIEVIPRWCCL